MRKHNVTISAILILFTTMYVSYSVRRDVGRVWYDVGSESFAQSSWSTLDRKVYVNPKYVSGTHIRGDMDKFLKAIARAEAGEVLTAVNSTGHMGKYQFHPRTLQAVGIEVSQSSFLEDERLQDSAMILNLKLNRNILRKIIRDYDGTWKDGIYITASGILAGAHLVGAGGIQAYFYPDEYGHRTEDANGTHVSHYIGKFSGYRISL